MKKSTNLREPNGTKLALQFSDKRQTLRPVSNLTMHKDLASNLHSDKCNELIRLLQKCHEEHTFLKFAGYCNSFHNQMKNCLKEEWLERRQINNEKSKERKEKLWKLLREAKD